ncbi:MAG TPA: redoxin domain-containing protein, partial [Brevundimonas sp.]
PTEIAEFARLNPQFEERDAVVLGGSTDNEFSKLAWRRDHPDLANLAIWSFADNGGKFARQLGVLNEEEGVALRATFVVDPHNIVQHVYVTNLNVGRAPADTLRVVDALQTDELCACNRPVGGETLAA